MTLKSISKQVVDEFIGELLKTKFLEERQLESLKELLYSGIFRKEDLVKLLNEEEDYEDS
jgi:hypothetical protein